MDKEMDIKDLPSDLDREIDERDLPKDLQSPAKKERTTNPKRVKFAEESVGSDSSSNQLLNLARTAIGQGLLPGVGDELEAALRTGSASGEEYEKTRDQIRSELKGYKSAHPVAANVSEIGGGLASLAIPGLGALRGIKGAAALGALSGLGSSEANLTGDKTDWVGAAKDTATGGTLGALIAKFPKAAVSLLAGAAGYSYLGDKDEPLSVQNAMVAGVPALTTAAITRGLPRTNAAKAFKAGKEKIPLTSHSEFGARQAEDISKVSSQLNELRENYTKTVQDNLQSLGNKTIENPLNRDPNIKAKFKEAVENSLSAAERRGEQLPPRELASLLEKQQLTPEEFIKLDSFLGKRSGGEGNQDLYKFMKEFELKGREAGLNPTYDAKSTFKDIQANISEPVTGMRQSSSDPLSKDQQNFSGIGDFLRDKNQEAKGAAFGNMSATQSRVSEINPELGKATQSTIDQIKKASEESRLAGVIGGESPSDASGVTKLAAKVAQAPAWTGFQAGVLTQEVAEKLMQVPGVSHIGKLLSKALQDGDRVKQGTAMFLIKQNPQARRAAGIELDKEKK